VVEVNKHGFLRKICACSQGENPCSHFVVLVIALRAIRSRDPYWKFIVAERPRSKRDQTLKEFPLAELEKRKVRDELPNRSISPTRGCIASARVERRTMGCLDASLVKNGFTPNASA
jgi:hypothetical protein